jgi:alkylation response protein AidB-like acyl-CoA dehydrogenase
MAGYQAPIADMAFTLKEVVGIDDLSMLPAFTDIDLEILPDVLGEAARFFGEVIAPTNRDGDIVGAVRNDDGTVTAPPGFREAYEQYVAGGWGAMSFDPEYGGAGYPWVIGTAISEMMTAANMALSLNPLLTQGSIHALSAHGSEQQKLTYLPKLISSEWSGTMNLTEPQAGSDVGALTAKAEPRDDGSWSISGQKIFITWGEHDLSANIVHLVLARTPDSPPGTRGISLFIVPKFIPDADGNPGEKNDVECVSIEHKMGIHGSPTCVLQFGDNGGAVGYLIGHERLGMGYMFTMMNQARLAIGLQGVALADRAYQQALEYAVERRQGTRPDTARGESVAIIDHPDVRRMLMTIKANIEAARSLVYLNAKAVDISAHHPDEQGRRAGKELTDLLTPLSKAWSTDLGNELTSLALQVHGGMGFIEETGAAQHYRDIRIGAIYEGTNGIQAVDLVGRKLPMRDGAVVQELIGQIGETIAELTNAGLTEIADRLELATADVQAAGRWLLEKGAGRSDDGLAGATPYLRMLATTVGGWLLAKGALAAQRLAAEGDSEYATEFLEAKIVTAHFFATQLLPQVHGLLPSVMAGADDLYAISDEALR